MTLLAQTNARYDLVGWEALGAQPVWRAAVLGALALAIGVAVYASWRERRGLPPGRWGWLLALRLIALGGAALAVVGLERREMTEQTEPSRVVLLVDASASMRLPGSGAPNATGPSPTRSDAAVSAIDPLSSALSSDHTVRLAAFGETVRYAAAAEEATPGSAEATEPRVAEERPFLEPSDPATRLGDALRRVLADHEATPLAAVVVLSDGGSNRGVDPQRVVGSASTRGVPIHAVGFGPLVEPPSVRLRDLTAPTRVFARDRVSLSLAVAASRDATGAPRTWEVAIRLYSAEPNEPADAATAVEETITVELAGGESLGSASHEFPAPPAGKYVLQAEVRPDGPDADPSDNRLEAAIEVVDRPTRVLLVAGGPSRDYRFLRDQLNRDDSFEVDALLQTATGAVSQDADRVVEAFPESEEEFDAYDAVVAMDADWNAVGEPALAALGEWVSRQGGALVFVAGSVQTGEWVRRAESTPLTRLLPVTLRDDPLAATLDSGGVNEPLAVRLTPDGERADFLRLTTAPPQEDWSRLEGFYVNPLPADPKLGATVYARLGADASASHPPLLVEQLYGAGRVVYLAAGQTWRLRAVDPAWFTTFHTKLLRHATQGRLLGAASRGSLYFDRGEYEVGERMTLRLTLRGGGDEGPAPRLRWIGPGGGAVEATFQPVADQPGVYTATTDNAAEGRHEVAVRLSADADAAGELTASATVVLPTRESATTTRDEARLRAVAEASGGRYWADAGEAIVQIAAATPSRAEVSTLLGPPDRSFGERVSRLALGLLAGGLLLEWVLRRLWRLA